MATIYEQRDLSNAPHVRLNNSTGTALVQYELTVISGIIMVADEAIASGAVGSFAIVEDLSLQIADYVATEDTFATVNAVVYWDPSSGDFSDTSTAGYYPVGIVQEIKNSNDVVLMLANRETVVVPA